MGRNITSSGICWRNKLESSFWFCLLGHTEENLMFGGFKMAEQPVHTVLTSSLMTYSFLHLVTNTNTELNSK